MNLIRLTSAEGRTGFVTQDEFNSFCMSLAHTTHVVQWGGADVWKVGSPSTYKLFAVGGWNDVDDGSQYCVTFKTSDIGYEMLRDAPGCRPAPYLASRGMKWIQRVSDESLSDEGLKDYLRNSHRLASLNLTKKFQKELGLNQSEVCA